MKRYLNARHNFAPDGWQAWTRLLSTGGLRWAQEFPLACCHQLAAICGRGAVPGLFGRARGLFGAFSTVAIPV